MATVFFQGEAVGHTGNEISDPARRIGRIAAARRP
jgi:hypothetical protein